LLNINFFKIGYIFGIGVNLFLNRSKLA